MSNITEVLSGKRGLAGIQQLLSAASVGQTLQSMVDNADAIDACHLRRAKFKPDRKLTAYYDLHLRRPSGSGSAIRSIAVTWLPEGVQHPTLDADGNAMQTEAIHRGLAAPFHRLISETGLVAHCAAESNMQIQVSPLDPRYPQLTRLSDPAYARELLASCAASDHGGESERDRYYAIHAIRYRPRQRHVLQYVGETNLVAGAPWARAAGALPDDQDTVFAKLYQDASHQHFFALTHQIADWLAASMPDVAVLRPLAYASADTTTLYEKANGSPLSDDLCKPAPSVANHLQRTGAALRVLHNTPANLTQGLPSLELPAELAAIARTCEHIQALLPAVGQDIRTLLEQARISYAKLPQEAPTFIHGDFKADHVLVAADQLTLIDFDSCALADPAFDIGKFLADLDWWYTTYQQPGLKQARDAFLAGYGLGPNHPRLQRAQVWEVLIRIKITSHRIRLFDHNWSARTALAVKRLQNHID